MTVSQKILIKKLLTGHFLRRMMRRGKPKYTLYDKNINPILRIRPDTIEKLDRFLDPKLKLWKKNKHGDMTLSLTTVRQLHGKTTLKQLYKHRHQIEQTGAIYKTRKKVTKTTANEKVYYLF